MTVTIGADPEFALQDAAGKIIPAAGLIGGTKAKPLSIDGLPTGYFVHEDNVAVELGVPPCSDLYLFADQMDAAKKAVTKMLPKGHKLVAIDSNNFTKTQLAYENAQEFGCDPDYDAYTMGKERTNLPNFGNKRSYGGHIHIGGTFNCPTFAAALFADAMIGVPLVSYGLGGGQRTKWYGRPGIYREKPYGIEYRTPSAAWAAGNSGCVAAGSLAMKLGRLLEDTPASELMSYIDAIDWARVRRIIIGNEARTATEHINELQDLGINI